MCSPELLAGYHAGGLDVVARHVGFLALHGGNGVAMALADGNGIGDDGRGNERADAVVDEDDGVGRREEGGEGGDAIADGGVAGVTGGDGVAEFGEGEFGGGAADEVGPFVATYDIDVVDEGMTVKGSHGVGEDGYAFDLHVLLGYALCGTGAFAAGEDEGLFMTGRGWSPTGEHRERWMG